MREDNNQQGIGKEICMPSLRIQDILQAENANCKTQGDLNMDNSKETNEAIGEFQILEQQLRGFLAQKQMVQVELQEIENALEELDKTKDEVYKILSGVMIKADKDTLKKELEEKKKISDLRISSIEKQEKSLEEKIITLKEKISSAIKK